MKRLVIYDDETGETSPFFGHVIYDADNLNVDDGIDEMIFESIYDDYQAIIRYLRG